MYCQSFTLLNRDYISNVTKQSKHRLYNTMKLSGANCLVVFSLLQLLVAFSHCKLMSHNMQQDSLLRQKTVKKVRTEERWLSNTPDLLLGNYQRHQRMKNYLEEVQILHIYYI
ncbi:MEG-2 (ESP15) family [Schistosoma mansoni]|uniref:MEG-2 (ESP15) family n=1 Tax=Schistosoma mansoni TaxID=6183 RepID=UPI00022C8362|nr:MEG-2 (ESP15) family [Schistosoma mansoni]|eukprot:XP_018647429.1 MEG-2 (ESP15) family [Schistosoma mansoni]